MSRTLLKPMKKRSGRKRSFHEVKISESLKSNFPWQTVTKCICAFLLSRTSLIGGVHPLGYAMAAAMFSGKNAYAVAFSAILGLAVSGVGLIGVGKYIIAITVFALMQERFIPSKLKTGKISALIASASVLVSGFFLLFADTTFRVPLIYDTVILIVETATIWLAVRAFSVAIPLIFSLKLRHSLTSEETVSVAFFTGGILCGFGNAGIGGVISVTGVLCVLCVLLFAVRFGSLHGCSAGIIMGIVCCLSRGRIDACAASFALSGLCAGYAARHGKWAACISFIMANAVVTILSNGSTEVLINIFDTAVAAVILYCVPQRVFDSINHFSGYSPPAFEIAANRLSYAQKTVESLETDFRKIFNLRNTEDNNAILLYKRTAHKTCGSCGLRKYCWGRDINATKSSMDVLCHSLHNGEEVTAQNAPEHCLRKEQFVTQFSRMYEVYKNDCLWSEKISDFREAVYSGFSSIGNILGKSGEMILSETECDAAASDDVKCRLRKEGIISGNVYVSGSNENTTVRIKLDSCGGFGRCENAVCKVLEETFSMPFVRTGIRSCGDCWCSYVVKPSFSITTAVAGAIKANRKVSGDYVMYSLLDRHTYAIILCDGMGSGEIAREESKTSASLLMRLLETGIDPQTAINLINAMLLCAFSETLAAIDLCLISLDDGSSKIYKCGGASTYAKTEKTVAHIFTKSLPAGAFVSGDTEVFSIPSEKGSMVVLLSDGVSNSETSKLPWIKNMINDYDGTEPEALARMILEKAKENSDSKPEDDLTVVAAYIG